MQAKGRGKKRRRRKRERERDPFIAFMIEQILLPWTHKILINKL
jgi:hypothetical protein